MLPQEREQIIESIYKVCMTNDARYLLVPAYKWLMEVCNGFPQNRNWDHFTEHYSKWSFRKSFIFNQSENQKPPNTRNQRLIEREKIYNTIIRRIT